MPKMENFFEKLKNLFITVRILDHFDLTKTCVVETDPWNFGLSAILSQKDYEGRLPSIAFLS
jgi:hypothetical protein